MKDGQNYDVSLAVESQNVNLGVSDNHISLTVSEEIKAVSGEAYEGDYEFTPTQEAQVVHIKNKVALDNITINPIPNNYGLIGWNGSVLTVT